MTATPLFPQTPHLGVAQITTTHAPGDVVTALTAGSNGTKITGLWATSTASAAYDQSIAIVGTGSAFWLFGIAANAGTDGVTPAANLFSQTFNQTLAGKPTIPEVMMDEDGCPFINLKASVALKLRCADFLLDGIVTLFVVGADY